MQKDKYIFKILIDIVTLHFVKITSSISISMFPHSVVIIFILKPLCDFKKNKFHSSDVGSLELVFSELKPIA